MVSRDRQRGMLGHIGFHGPPDERGMAEMGYTVLPPFRRRGYALEAARGMMDWALREHGVRLFQALYLAGQRAFPGDGGEDGLPPGRRADGR